MMSYSKKRNILLMSAYQTLHLSPMIPSFRETVYFFKSILDFTPVLALKHTLYIKNN